MRVKFRKPKKCKATGKSKFSSERDAGRAMMRIWSHDTSADIHDLHTYICESCGSWHVGHISYYQESLKVKNGTTGAEGQVTLPA